MPLHEYELETERLVLKSLSAVDAPALSEVANDRRITSVTRSIVHPFLEADAVEWIKMKQEDPDGFSFGIFLKPEARLIGQIGLLTIEWSNDVGELGFFVGFDHWGNGYVTEAARRVVRFGFEEIGLNRISAHHIDHNSASGVVLVKIGMQREGVFRQRVKKEGVYEDIVAYALLRDEYFDPADASRDVRG